MKTTLLSAAYAVIVVLLLCRFAAASAIWTLTGTDLFDRDLVCELELAELTGDLSCTLTGEDGTTLFDNSFARFGESDGDPQIVLLQDFDGLVGGQVSLVGDGLLAGQIDIETHPSITEASLILWDQFSGFQSAANVSATLNSVSVPEAAGCVIALIGACGLLCLGFRRAH